MAQRQKTRVIPRHFDSIIQKPESNMLQHAPIMLWHAEPFKKPCHNGFSFDLDDHKNKWSRHRSFLYGGDWSPGMQCS